MRRRKTFSQRAVAIVTALVAVAVVCGVVVASNASPVLAARALAGSSAAAVELLPDLNPLEPRAVTVEQNEGHWALAFGAASDNLGAGPLMVHGSRADVASPMQVSQLVLRSDGTTASYADVGTLEYTFAADHQHWHFLNFMTYELRDIQEQLVRPSQKTGFCLLDDYDSSGFNPKNNPPNKPAKPVYLGSCNRNAPDSLTIDEGISVGYGDYYNPLLEGQSIDLTGVADGRYYLVVRVNQARLLRESDYENDASSVQLELRHPQGPSGAPSMKILATCRDADHCLAPLTLGVSAPAKVARGVRTFPLRASLSDAGTVNIDLRVGSRVITTLQRRLPAGPSTLVVGVPRTASRPSTAKLVVRASGPGLEPASRTLSIRLR